MPKVRSASLLSLLAFALTGCTTVKIYPLCFYEEKPDSQSLQQDYVPGLRQTFASIVDADPQKISVTPDARWIVARTTHTQDADLLRMWPRVGCIGPAGSTSEVKLQADCVAYVTDFIQEKRYTELGQYKGTNGNTYYNESRDPTRLVYCARKNQ